MGIYWNEFAILKKILWPSHLRDFVDVLEVVGGYIRITRDMTEKEEKKKISRRCSTRVTFVFNLYDLRVFTSRINEVLINFSINQLSTQYEQ
jgi:hypothetical protein